MSLTNIEQDAEKAEIQASSFDRLRMRWSDFNGLDLMVSLSNHEPHRFSDYPLRIRPGGKASPNKLTRSVRSIGIAFLSRPVLTGDMPHFSSLAAI